MKKFRFTLQTLLDLNHSMEKQQKNELGLIHQALNKLQEEKGQVEQEVFKLQGDIRAQLKENCKIESYRSLNLYLLKLNKKSEVLQEMIYEKNLEKQKIQEMLTKTIMKRKSLEKLQEKQYQAYMEEVKKEEEKESDDFVTFNYLYG